MNQVIFYETILYYCFCTWFGMVLISSEPRSRIKGREGFIDLQSIGFFYQIFMHHVKDSWLTKVTTLQWANDA